MPPNSPPRGAVGHTSLVLRLRVVRYKQIFSAENIPGAIRIGLRYQSGMAVLHSGSKSSIAFDQLTDRMALRGVPKILGGEMYIYLRAGDQPVPQQISHRHQTHPGLDQMRGKSMPQLMRRDPLLDPGFSTGRAHAFIDGVP